MGNVIVDRTGRTLPGYSRVVKEVGVFCCERGVNKVLWHLIKYDIFATTGAVDLVEYFAIAVQDCGAGIILVE